MSEQELISPPAPADLAARQALVERILASRGFQRAARLRELLLYITSHATHPEALGEQQIGVHVFGRPETYNPADDNIVRASARQLRTKLKEYFDTEGVHEPLILDIPKGAYLPVFTERPLAAAPPAPVAPPKHYLWIALTATLAVIALWLAIDRNRPAEWAAESDSVFAQYLRQSPGPIRFVLTDSGLASMNRWSGLQPDVDQYGSREFVESGAREFAGNEVASRIWRDMSQRQITSLADVGVLAKLLQGYPSSARRIETRHAKHVRARDLKSGNLIVTGSKASNPWAGLFDAGLNFQFDKAKIVNRQPLPGEATAYELETGHWSRIALVNNLSGSGTVLLIAGISFEGTEGAGEFLLRPESLVEVRRLLGVSPTDPLPPFELVLSSQATEGTAYSSKIVAWRRH